MAFWNKAKGLFNKVWSGVKKGAKAVGGFVKDKVLPVYDKIKPIVGTALNAIAPGLGTAVDKGVDITREVVNKDANALLNRISNRGLKV